jgi:hypothetical protein
MGEAMTTTTEDTRYRLDAIAAAIRAAMEGADFTSTAEWEQPEQCRCIREGKTCLDVQARAGMAGCQGRVYAKPLPPDKSLTPDELVSVLPAPDSDGMVSGSDAAAAMQAVILDRLSWNPYWVTSLAKRLEEAFTALDGPLTPDSAKQGTAEWLPKCQVCSVVLPSGSKSSRRTCSDKCRQTLRRMRRQ